MEIIEKIKEYFVSADMVSIATRIILALLVIVIGTKLVKVLVKKMIKGKGFSRFSKTVQTFLRHVISITLNTVVVLIGASILGLNLSALSALIASAGLTIGLALQGGLTNMVGGVMIVGLKPFEVNDYIEAGDISGTVTDIGIFYTTLQTPDNKKIVVPNGTLSGATITNHSANETRRLDLPFSVSYNTDLDVAKKVLLACAQADERILKEPCAVAVMTEHSESALILQLRVWVKNPDYWAVKFDMLEQVKRSFDQFGVEIPFNQLDVHVVK